MFCAIHLKKNRNALLRNALGMWKERTDIPELFTHLHKELDRSISRRKKKSKKIQSR